MISTYVSFINIENGIKMGSITVPYQLNTKENIERFTFHIETHPTFGYTPIVIYSKELEDE